MNEEQMKNVFTAGDLQTDAEALNREEKQETATEQGSERKGFFKKKRRIFLGTLLLLFCVAAVVSLYYYNKMMLYYQTHFFPHTIINGIDCGGMEPLSVVAMLDSWMDDYALEVTGRDYKSGESGSVLGCITSEDIRLVFDGTAEAVASILERQDESKWIQAYFGQDVSYSFEQSMTFDEGMLADAVASWEACRKGNMRKAQDAYISEYSEARNCYEIINETIGTELDVDKVIQLACEVIGRCGTSLDVEEEGCYAQAAVMRDDKTLTHIVNTVNRWLGTCITYDWNGTEVKLDYTILKDWITLGEKEPVLDEEEAADFVKRQAAEYDTYGKRRNFITTLGVELTLPSGYYGWKTDTKSETEELIQLIYQGSVVKREPIYSSEAKKKGMSDIGDSYVEADLTHQHLYLYQNGKLALETDFVSGTMNSTPDCVTPAGVFGLSYKTTNAVLRGANYRTPVNYWMPFYGNYGMHDATWRSEFGGDIYITGGSHGCLNLPLDMAEKIYKNVSAGFPVICYYYQVDPLAGMDEAGDTVPEMDNGEYWEEDGTDDWGEGEGSVPGDGNVGAPGEGNSGGASDGVNTGAGGNAASGGENSGSGGGDTGTVGGNAGTADGNTGTTGGNADTSGGNTGTTGGNADTSGGNTGTTGGNTGTSGGNTDATGGNTGATGGNTGSIGGENAGTIGGGDTGTTGAGNTGGSGEGNTGTAGGNTGTGGEGNTDTAGGNTGAGGEGDTDAAGEENTGTSGGDTDASGEGEAGTAGGGDTDTTGGEDTDTAGGGSTESSGEGGTDTAEGESTGGNDG